MRKWSIVAVVAVVALLAMPAWAGAGDNKVRFGVVYSSPTGDLSERIQESDIGYDLDMTVDVDPDSAVGFGVDYEYMFTDLMGLDVNLFYSDHDADVVYGGTYSEEELGTGTLDGLQTGSISMMPLTVSLNFHFTPDAPYDFYAGPLIGYVLYGDVDLDRGDIFFTLPGEAPELFDSFDAESFSTDDDFTYGAVVGVDVPFGKAGWMFSAAVRYLSTSAEFTTNDEVPETFDLDMNPWVVQVGVGYQF